MWDPSRRMDMNLQVWIQVIRTLRLSRRLWDREWSLRICPRFIDRGKIKVGAGVETFQIKVAGTNNSEAVEGDEKLKPIRVGDTSTEPIRSEECGERWRGKRIESIKGEGVCLDGTDSEFIYTVSVVACGIRENGMVCDVQVWMW